MLLLDLCTPLYMRQIGRLALRRFHQIRYCRPCLEAKEERRSSEGGAKKCLQNLSRVILNSAINNCPKIRIPSTKRRVYGIKIRIPLQPSKCFQSNCIMLSLNFGIRLTFFPATRNGVSSSWSVFPPWPLPNTSVIGTDDNDGIVPYACLFGGFNKPSDISVQFRKFDIIGRRIVSVGMTYMIRIIHCKSFSRPVRSKLHAWL